MASPVSAISAVDPVTPPTDLTLQPVAVATPQDIPAPITDQVDLSQTAQVLALELQGASVSSIAAVLGLTAAAVSADLGIPVTPVAATTPVSVTIPSSGGSSGASRSS